ncbi:hypothetical protein GOBAR_DD19948 [Gossypium barbadense]|nr:hypothetical protein GOBAR_DD19948 [Gossypium barbadense]
MGFFKNALTMDAIMGLLIAPLPNIKGNQSNIFEKDRRRWWSPALVEQLVTIICNSYFLCHQEEDEIERVQGNRENCVETLHKPWQWTLLFFNSALLYRLTYFSCFRSHYMNCSLFK